MNKTEFVDALTILSNALPCPAQEKRISALYEFFGEKPISVVTHAAREGARMLERFPTPKVFGDLVSMNTPPDIQGDPRLNWNPKVLTDEQIIVMMTEGGKDPRVYLRGVLAFVGGDLTWIERTTTPIKRIWALAAEIVGSRMFSEEKERFKNAAENFGGLTPLGEALRRSR